MSIIIQKRRRNRGGVQMVSKAIEAALLLLWRAGAVEIIPAVADAAVVEDAGAAETAVLPFTQFVGIPLLFAMNFSGIDQLGFQLFI